MITRKNTARRRTQGFTLTEIAIVLGIIGLILGAIWVAAASVYNAQRLNHANQATLQIAQGVRALYATSSSTGYATSFDMTSALITANAVPNDLVASGGTTLTGPFPGGATGIIATSDGNGFVVVMSGVPKAACISVLSNVGGTARDPGLFNADAVPSAGPATTDATTTGTALTAAITPSGGGTTVSAAAATTGTGPSSGQGGCTNTTNKIRMGFSLK
jgi:prepilin-type N-terminal cleavage/methylation domain-containing protein